MWTMTMWISKGYKLHIQGEICNTPMAYVHTHVYVMTKSSVQMLGSSMGCVDLEMSEIFTADKS